MAASYFFFSLTSKDPKAKLTMSQIAFAGGFSAVPTTLLMTPTERIKVLLQIQGTKGARNFTGPIDASRAVLAEGGIKSLYRGSLATLLRDVPGSVAYFVAYEWFKKVLKKDDQALSPLAILFAGGMAGVANWSVSIVFNSF